MNNIARALLVVVLLVLLARVEASQVTFSINRTFDDFHRIDSFDVVGEYDKQFISYRPDGRINSVSNGIATVVYLYSSAGRRCGYELHVSNGVDFVQSIVRDAYR